MHYPLLMLVVGSTAGGLILGIIASALSLVLAQFHALRAGLLGGVASISILATLWLRARAWLPQRACQVSGSHLRRYALKETALRWGLTLGVGVCTFLVTPALYALIAVAVVQPNAFVAGGICVLYGISRGTTIAVFALVVGKREESGTYGREPGRGLERALRLPLVAVTAAALVLTLG